ncbi:hypothetical protein [Klebsiella pneumoniae]|uniref:hypothetical protein n=1 Tax=Klebsiella pneumoniae TaxID=573 RepID=UPI001D196F3B|nr:hypothetical protein [Klebsiella pneumoniae]
MKKTAARQLNWPSPRRICLTLFASSVMHGLTGLSRVAPLMAADLNVLADRMTEVLIEHVHKHISVLGEPEFNPAED